MRATSRRTTSAMGAAGIGALLFTYGCGANAAPAAESAAAAATGTPVVVSCEPNQRTLVRPAVVDGAAVSQVECVSIADAPVAAPQPAPVARPAPVVYQRAARPVVSDGLEDARIVPASYPTPAARPVRTQEVVYDQPRVERPVKKTRSVKKSAIIIGSSAGAGAAVGAAVGGKKGALLGAVLGGGGATLWDQITRRK